MGGAFTPLHLLFAGVVALLLFGGRGNLSGIMGDAAKGIRAFQDGLKEDPKAAQPAESVKAVERPKDETHS